VEESKVRLSERKVLVSPHLPPHAMVAVETSIESKVEVSITDY
jgi:hypothetical protein